MAEDLTPNDFQPHLGKTFRVREGRHALALAAIERGRPEEAARAPGLREPFNLIFRGPPCDLLAPGLYTMETDGGTAFALYVMPIHTPARDRQDYQAAFN
jgi:hypothetical protein